MQYIYTLVDNIGVITQGLNTSLSEFAKKEGLEVINSFPMTMADLSLNKIKGFGSLKHKSGQVFGVYWTTK